MVGCKGTPVPLPIFEDQDGIAEELRSATQLDVDDDPKPQPPWLPPLVPAVRKWDDATIRLPEPSTC